MTTTDPDTARHDLVMRTHLRWRQTALRQLVVQKRETHRPPGAAQSAKRQAFERREVLRACGGKRIGLPHHVLPRRRDLRSGAKDAERNTFKFVAEKIAMLAVIRPTQFGKRRLRDQGRVGRVLMPYVQHRHGTPCFHYCLGSMHRTGSRTDDNDIAGRAHAPRLTQNSSGTPTATFTMLRTPCQTAPATNISGFLGGFRKNSANSGEASSTASMRNMRCLTADCGRRNPVAASRKGHERGCWRANCNSTSTLSANRERHALAYRCCNSGDGVCPIRYRAMMMLSVAKARSSAVTTPRTRAKPLWKSIG